MIDLAGPGDVRNVDHAVQAVFQFDESTIAGKVADLAFDLRSGRIFLQRAIPGIGFELANAQRDFLFFAIDSKHYSLEFLLWLEDIGRFRDALGPGEFGDMN